MATNWQAYRAHKHKPAPVKAREMAALKQAGLTCKQIAAVYGVSPQMVTNLLRRYDPLREPEWAHEDWH